MEEKYNFYKKELKECLQFLREARMPTEMINNNPTVISLSKKIDECEKEINKNRGVNMERNTNNNQKNNYMGGDFEYHLYNDINEFISDNDSYSHLNRDNFIDNMEENPSYLAYVVEKTAEEVYIEETDVGGDGYIELCNKIAVSNINEDLLDEVLKVIWDTK